MKNKEEANLEMDVLAKRLDTEPELKNDIMIKPLWKKLVIKTQTVIQGEQTLNTIRQEVAEAKGAAKSLLEMIQERVVDIDKQSKGKKPKRVNK